MMESGYKRSEHNWSGLCGVFTCNTWQPLRSQPLLPYCVSHWFFRVGLCGLLFERYATPSL